MNIVVYLVFLMAVEPVPTYAFLDNFKSVKDCQERKTAFVKAKNLTKEQASHFVCMPVILGEVSEPM